MDLKNIEKIVRLGYGVIPIRPRSKEPVGKWTENVVYDPAKIEAVFRSDSNFGIICENLLVIDIDGEQGETDFRAMAAELGELPDGPEIATGGGGRHLFFKRPETQIVGRTKIEFHGHKTSIDLRTGRQYVIGPGSIHPNGAEYMERVPLCPVVNLPGLPARWIDEFPKRRGETVPPAALEPLPNIDREKIVERCAAYVRALPASIQGENGSKALMRMMTAIYRGFGLNDEEAGPIEDEYNARAVPRWLKEEMDHKREGAKKAELNRPDGWLRNHPHPKAAETSKAKPSVESPPPVEPTAGLIVSLASEVKPKTIDWLWPNRFQAGALGLLQGQHGTTKSFLAIDMAARISTGRNWPDDRPCAKGAVVMFQGEDSFDQVVVPRLQAADADLTKIVLFGGVIPDGELSIEPDFAHQIKKALNWTTKQTGLPVRLVIVDPIGYFWGAKNENDNREVRQCFRGLQKVAETTGAAFLLVQHEGKSQTSAATRQLGSTAISATPRTVWAVIVDETDRNVFSMAFVKGNNVSNQSGLRYRIANNRIEWNAGALSATADEIRSPFSVAGPEKKRGPPLSEKKRADAVRIVNTLIEMEGVPIEIERGEHALQNAGIRLTASLRHTIQNALSLQEGKTSEGVPVWEARTPAS